MSKKEIRLTNWQVPRDPKSQHYDAFKQAPEIDLNSQQYKDIGKIHHGDLQHAIERTIMKQEAARGVKIDQEAQPKPMSVNGVVDDRPNKEYWIPPRKGNR